MPCRGRDHRIGSQVDVVGGQIAGRAAGRTGGVGHLQRRLDDAGDAQRYLVLEVEDILCAEPRTVWAESDPGSAAIACCTVLIAPGIPQRTPQRCQQHALKRDELFRVERQIRYIIEAIKDGIRTSGMKDDLPPEKWTPGYADFASARSGVM